MLGLRFCARAFSSCGERGPLFIVVCGPLTVAASLVAEHRLQTRRLSNCGSRASRSAARGIFPDQGSNPCPLHWQADSQPLRQQGRPKVLSLSVIRTHIMLPESITGLCLPWADLLSESTWWAHSLVLTISQYVLEPWIPAHLSNHCGWEDCVGSFSWLSRSPLLLQDPQEADLHV